MTGACSARASSRAIPAREGAGRGPGRSSWSQNWVVISAEVGANVTIDGATPDGCIVEPSGAIDGYESRRCPLRVGVHGLSGHAPFGIVGYGYGSAGSYAFAGGADVKKIYEPRFRAEPRARLAGSRDRRGGMCRALLLRNRFPGDAPCIS